jgi:hypothetical protein
MREVALVACLLGAMAWGSATVVRAETPYEADPGLIPMGLFTVFFNTEGPLSYATLTPGDLPAEAVPLGTVKGRGCQYGVSIPIGGTSFITRVSGAVGRGGYEKALRDIRNHHPGLKGIYDVKVDEHILNILTVFERLCVEVTAKGFR